MQYLIALAIAIILYLFQTTYYKKHWKDGLTIDIAYNKSYAHIGDTVELTEQVQNHKRLPLPVLYIKFKTSKSFLYDTKENASISDYYYRNDAFSISGNQQVTRKFTFQVSRRGYFSIDSINLVANDLFMTKTYAYIQKNHAVLYVYPQLLTTRRELLLTNSIIGDILTKNLYEDPLSFRGIRNYTTQDTMRYINWKATAKTGALQVNTYFDTQHTNIVLLVNLDTHTMQRTDTMKEYVIRVAATLINNMASRGFSIKLAVNAPDILAKEPIIIEEGAGREHLHTLFQALSRLDIAAELIDISTFFDEKSSVFQEKDAHTTYIILSNYRKHDLLFQCLEKQQQGYSLSFICPDYSSCYSIKDFYVKHSDQSRLSDVYFWEVKNDEL